MNIPSVDAVASPMPLQTHVDAASQQQCVFEQMMSQIKFGFADAGLRASEGAASDEE